MTDNITVSRELLQRMVNAIDMLIPTLPGLNDKGRTWLRDEIIESTDALRAALEQTAPVQEPDRIAQLEAANTNLFEQGQKMHKRIQELEKDCKIGAQEMVKAYEEIDNLKAQVSWQKPVAWCQLGLGGKSIAYFDGKPMIMTGHVGNQHHPTPLFTAQPRKAVRLTTDEIKEAIRHLYQDATALQMSMDLSLDEFRAIEAAVLKANGVEE